MKKIIIILSCLCFLSKAQNPNFITINVWRITAFNSCGGDSIRVNFKFSPPQQGTITTAHFSMNTTLVWSGNYNLFYSMPQETWYPLATNDSCYTITLGIPIGFPYGTTNINTTGVGMSFMVNNCPTTSINQLEPQINTIEPIYFDLQGNKISKQYNTLIIEQIGLKRKKVFITD